MKASIGIVVIALLVVVIDVDALPVPGDRLPDDALTVAPDSSKTDKIPSGNKLKDSAVGNESDSSGAQHPLSPDDADKSPSSGGGDIHDAVVEAQFTVGQLEPIFRSTSQIESSLGQIQEKALGERQHREDFAPGQGKLSSYLKNGDSSGSPTTEDFSPAVKENQDTNGKMKANINETNKTVKSVIAGRMTKDTEPGVVAPTLRIKRELGWDIVTGFGGDVQDDPFSFDLGDDVQRDPAWGRIPYIKDVPIAFDLRPQDHERETEWNSKRGGKHDSDGDVINAYLNRLERRRRNKEDLHTFLQNMPTLEGLRKRAQIEIEPENEAVIPDPGPPYPHPPNLPPPGNVIHPVLSPDEALAWQPAPNFEEDNARLEEQTNAVDMMNSHRNDRIQYLKSVERSIMMQPLEDLAIQLAGGYPILPVEAMRVRRVMQIPPPPPYGRKVVKSLYRKKAYGIPFEESSFDEMSDTDVVDQEEEEAAWEDHLPFGRTQESDVPSDQETELIARLLSALAEKEAKDRLLTGLMSLRDVPSSFKRKILFEALATEMNLGTSGNLAPGANVDGLSTEESSYGNLDWPSSDSAGGDSDEAESENDLDMAPQNENAQGESSHNGFLSEGFQSETSALSGNDKDYGLHSNTFPNTDAVDDKANARILFNKITRSSNRPETNARS